MLNITITEILNEIDQTQYILYAEWTNTCFKIILLISSGVPLMGEMLTEEIDFYSKEHSKSFNEYLEDTKNTFSSKNTEIQYFLQDNKFEWRRNKKWVLGKIKVCPISNIITVSEILCSILEHQRHLQNIITKLKSENELLTNTTKELDVSLKQMIESKADMEKELYTKFILLLNTKKKRIRKLENNLKNRNTIYDASTDPSEDSDADRENAKNGKLKLTKKISNKRIDQNEESVSCKKSKLTDRNSVKEMKATTSTAIEKNNYSESFSNEIFKSMLNASVSSNESECEIELRMSETNTT